VREAREAENRIEHLIVKRIATCVPNRRGGVFSGLNLAEMGGLENRVRNRTVRRRLHDSTRIDAKDSGPCALDLHAAGFKGTTQA
jgi:hypothetical protein